LNIGAVFRKRRKPARANDSARSLRFRSLHFTARRNIL
jgi:hypothetical protein